VTVFVMKIRFVLDPNLLQ